jgi:hypothetical protein
MPTPPDASTSAPRRRKGWEAASALLSDRIRKAGESRGFAVARLLTHWDQIVGSDLSAQTRPVRVGYTRDGFGATLTVLVQGAVAPLVEMQKARIRDRVNACYGYNAVTRIALTQTGAAGFAEPQAAFAPAPPAPDPAADPAVLAAARDRANGVQDAALRQALERLGTHILSRDGAGKRGRT